MSDEPSDDYLSAAAEVVEAAKTLDEARQKFRDMEETHMRVFQEVRDAEKRLSESLEKLKNTGTGRGK